MKRSLIKPLLLKYKMHLIVHNVKLQNEDQREDLGELLRVQHTL